MKKLKFLRNIVITTVAVSMSVFLLAGCQSKDSSSSSNGNSTNQNANWQARQEQMKQAYSDKLKELVSAGTITQAQSDKILAAMTAQRQGGGNFNRNRQNSGNGQNNSNGNSEQNNSNGQSGNNGQSSSNGQNGSNGNTQRMNPLSKLVTDGTITQDQADKVMTSLRSVMGNRNGRNGGNNNQNNNNNGGSSTTSSQQ